MKITLTKIEAARNELREAIILWFEDGDLASMHLLACSAHQVVADINTAKGGRDLIYDSLVIKDEGRKEWITKVKDAYNHLKHADRNPDPGHIVVLDSDLTEFFILFTCLGLQLMKFQLNAVERAFVIHFMVCHPEWVKVGANPFPGFSAASVASVKTVPKGIFFSSFIEANEKKKG